MGLFIRNTIFSIFAALMIHAVAKMIYPTIDTWKGVLANNIGYFAFGIIFVLSFIYTWLFEKTA